MSNATEAASKPTRSVLLGASSGKDNGDEGRAVSSLRRGDRGSQLSVLRRRPLDRRRRFSP